MRFKALHCRPSPATADLPGLWLLLLAAVSFAAEPAAARAAAGSPVVYDGFDYSPGELRGARSGGGWRGGWKASHLLPALIVDSAPRGNASAPPGVPVAQRNVLIQGTGDRNNPLRRALAEPFRAEQLFVRFQLRYEQAPSAQSGMDPEFFVLWMDRFEANDRATHSNGVPNIGLHLADRGPKQGRNVFMARITAARTAWSSVEITFGQTYQVVGRLAKSSGDEQSQFDRLEMWIDPRPGDLHNPDASVQQQTNVDAVRWIGFSTGRKTENDDRIHIDDLVLSDSWDGILAWRPAENLASSAADPATVWKEPVDFPSDIFPLLESRCFGCHAGASPEGTYRLDVRDEILGYSTGEVLAEPGRSASSRLIQRVTASSPDERMPPEGAGDPLTPQQVARLRAWIDQGLRWDDRLLPPPRRTSDHWAFQPIRRPQLPAAKRPGWVRTPVDHFIAAAHQSHQIAPAPEASRRVLIRRLYLDLIGLPPTPREIAEFTNDPSPGAYQRLVERLLRSPHYGERWGRYWLDLARWAESHGYQHDIVRPYAWRYRDFVIDSFNDDKPYDHFLRQQIAGDELQPYDDENLVATGFLAAARISGNNMDKAMQRNDVLVDIVNATSSAVLGLTLQCAQCHNHKFDPLTQRDYYRLQGFFVQGQLGNLSLRQSDQANPTDLSQWIPKPAFNFYQAEAKKLINKRRFQRTTRPHTWGFYSPATGDSQVERLPVVNRDPIAYRPELLKLTRARLLRRGEVSQPGPEVGRGWPDVLGETPSDLGPAPRTALADWLASPGNPLVARVWANRIWLYHFGRGIVATPSDFGTQGAAASHPELLDWLATELMQHGWSTKHLHRQIVLSSTYRQMRRHHAAHAAVDPNNTLLWCWPRRRLQAEAIRDSVLVASGELNRHIGGPSVPPERDGQALRRTIYLFQQRSNMPSVMAMFDAPSAVTSCSRRSVSTVALQPLYLMNSQFMSRRAQAMARRVVELAGDEPREQVKVALLCTLGRRPDPTELRQALALLASTELAREGASAAEQQQRRLTQLCLALMNLNEFVYIP